MKYIPVLLVAAVPFLCPVQSFSQRTDTVTITSANVATSLLKPGVHRYLVYFKNGKDSSRVRYQVWTRTIDLITYKNREAISVTQEWEDNDSVIHTAYSVCERKTFTPLYHAVWSKKAWGAFDFIDKTAFLRDTLLTDNDTLPMKKSMYAAFKQSLTQSFFIWHLDLETFPILPYKSNITFLINFYDPGSAAPKYEAYTVTGSGRLSGYDGQQIDCWLLTHSSPNNKEVFWISKKTNEVLKLEQEFNGRFRYKVKLGFSV